MKKKLTILYITHEGKLGGATKCLIDLCKLMKEKGHTVYVLSPFKNSEATKELKKENIKVISCLYSWCKYPTREGKIKAFLFKLLYKFNWISTKIILRKLRNVDIDIIHQNSSVLDIGIQLAKEKNAKLISHFREFGEEDQGLKYIGNKEKNLAKISNNSEKLIFVSKDLYESYKDYIDKDKVLIIYDGIPKTFLHKKEKQQYNKEKVKFLISGALQEGKGQDIAIKAVAKLVKENITNLKLLIIGRDITNYQTKLNKLIEKFHLENYIEIRGFTKDIKKVREEYDVELVCSQREAFGRVTIEAMMCSNLVIASASGASKELIQNGKNGYLFKPGDANSLAEKMKEAIANQEKRIEISQNGYEYSKKFTDQQNANEIEKVYKKVI